MRLHDPLEYWARRRPDLLVTADVAGTGITEITYGDASAVTSAWAARLLALGLAPGDRVALASANLAEAVLALLAASKAGLVTVPLNPRLLPEDHARFVRDSGARAVIAGRSLAPGIDRTCSGLGLPLLLLDGELPGWQDLRTWPRTPDPGVALPEVDDPVAVQSYTSGTTGRPKAALLTHDGFVPVSARWGQAGMRFEPGEVFYLPLPIMLMAGIMMVQHALWCGAAVGLDEFDPDRALDAVAHPGVAGATFVPTMIHMMLAAADRRPGGAPAPALRWLLYGGTPVSPALLARIMDTFACGLFQSYGCTEASAITLLTPEDHARALDGAAHVLDSVGRLAIDCELTLRDEDGAPVAPGEVGEICSRGPHVFRGYAGDPERTAAAHHGDWYRTGDLGSLDADGYLYLHGRTDHVIKSGGILVHPQEIERLISGVPGVGLVAVVGVPDERWGARIVAAVVPAPGADRDDLPAAVTAACRAGLAGYKVPREVVLLDALPLNATGKILKHVVRDDLAARSDEAAAVGAP